MKGRRFIAALSLALIGAGGVAASWALGSGDVAGQATTVATTVTATTTVTTAVTVTSTVTSTTTCCTTGCCTTTAGTTGGGGASSSSSSSSSGGGTGQQQQQQQQGGGVIVVITTPSGTTTTTTPAGTGVVAVTKTQSASGSVVSSPAGITCDLTCVSQSAPFSAGTAVSLTAVGTGSAPFQGWSGACAGTTGAVCTVVPTAGKVTNVGVAFGTGSFTPPAFLSVSRGSASVATTSTGWSVVVHFGANRAVVATACVLRLGRCVYAYQPSSLTRGSSDLALSIPRASGAGARTIRVVFRAGGVTRTVLWSIFLT